MIRHALIGSLFLAMAGCSQTATQGPDVAAGSACTSAVANDGSQLQAKVYDVEPIHREQFRARAITTEHLHGAKLFVPAEKGMTREYVHRAASCHAGSMAAADNPNDPLRPEGGVEAIEVESHNGSYAIAVTHSDEKVAEEILRRARALERGGDVQVKQVAQNATSRSAF